MGGWVGACVPAIKHITFLSGSALKIVVAVQFYRGSIDATQQKVLHFFSMLMFRCGGLFY